MGAVYLNSQLNIALAGAADNSEPSFLQRDVRDIRCTAPIEAHWDGETVEEFCVFNEDSDSDLKNA